MLKLIVDSLEAVEEPLRALYEEKDGKFALKVDGIEDTSGLKSALAAERKRADAEARDKKRWASFGKTPEEIQELLDAQQRLEEDKANKAGEWDKLKAQMNDKHQTELARRDETIGTMRKRLESELIDSKAVTAIAAEKGVPDLLLPHVQRFVKVDDDFNPVVVDAKGDPRVDAKGNPMTIHDLVKEMKASDVFGRAFEGSGHSGSGTQPGHNAGGAGAKKKSDFKSEKDRAAWVEANGFDAYKALPD